MECAGPSTKKSRHPWRAFPSRASRPLLASVRVVRRGAPPRFRPGPAEAQKKNCVRILNIFSLLRVRSYHNFFASRPSAFPASPLAAGGRGPVWGVNCAVFLKLTLIMVFVSFYMLILNINCTAGGRAFRHNLYVFLSFF